MAGPVARATACTPLRGPEISAPTKRSSLNYVHAAVRETFEETGITCEITGIVGVYSDPRHVILYTSDGEVRQEFSLVLTARAVSGQPTPSSESDEVRWVPASQVMRYTMDRSMRVRVNDFLARGTSPVVR